MRTLDESGTNQILYNCFCPVQACDGFLEVPTNPSGLQHKVLELQPPSRGSPSYTTSPIPPRLRRTLGGAGRSALAVEGREAPAEACTRGDNRSAGDRWSSEGLGRRGSWGKAGVDGQGVAAQELLEKLRWACLGPNYDWSGRRYLYDKPHALLPR